MDNTTSDTDLNLDPNMMTTQGQTPQVVTTTTSVTNTDPNIASNVIDITPGKVENSPLPDHKVVHIDVATTPNSPVIDITPPTQATTVNLAEPQVVAEIAPTVTSTTISVESNTPETNTPAPQVAILETVPSFSAPPANSLPPLPTETPATTPPIPTLTINVNPTQPVSAPVAATPLVNTPTLTPLPSVTPTLTSTPLAQTQNQTTVITNAGPNENVGFKIDTTSPLFEDPDKVVLLK